MGALAEARCQKTSSVARACGIARPRARAADDLSAQGSGLRARQKQRGDGERKVGFIENTAMRHRGSRFREATVASRLTDR